MDPPNIGAAVNHQTAIKTDNAQYDIEAAVYHPTVAQTNIAKYNRSTLMSEAKKLTNEEQIKDKKLLNCRYLN